MGSLKNKKILITCGPTWVAIDQMRVLSNRSTGQLGQMLAVHLKKNGSKVTVLEGPVLNPLEEQGIKIRKYFFYHELEKFLNEELKKNYDIVIHAAAVSDYQLAQPFQGKLSSQLKQLTLKLIPTKKLINTIKKKDSQTFLVGFKLVDKLKNYSKSRLLNDYLKNTKSDLVVINSLNQNKYEAVIVNNKQTPLGWAQSRKEVVEKLIKILSVEVAMIETVMIDRISPRST